MTTSLFEVTLQGGFNGQEVVSRWNYRGDGDDVPSGNAFGLASAMGLVPVAGAFPSGTLAAAMAAAVSNVAQWFQVIVRDVYDPLVFADLPFVPIATGALTGDVEAPFVAYGFSTNRVRTDIGRGYKRFPGVTESSTDTTGVINSTELALLNTLAGKLGEVLTFTESSLSMSYTPCVAKKFPYTTPSGKTAYKYNAVKATQLAALATGIVWSPYPTVRSQVSRQIGKGR